MHRDPNSTFVEIYETCTWCKGRGHFSKDESPDESQYCPVCNGLGKIGEHISLKDFRELLINMKR
jgi:DnaJ-class molecular chaperone